MISREEFSLEVTSGHLGGWIAGDGAPALLLHGGPGLSYEYLEGLAELGSSFRVAAYQQRGLAPSTLDGPFTLVAAIADAIAVLDGLGWDRALIVGHSWGGHLALRLAAAHPERVAGVLAVDPLGIVGDGGMAAFDTEMLARTPGPDRERAEELDRRAMAGEGTAEEAVESLRLLWPAYFADPGDAPPMPPVRLSVEAYSSLISEARRDTAEVAATLAGGGVRCGFVVGAGSPLPWGQAARATAEVIPGAVLTVVAGAGHYPWLEVPGCVRAALLSLNAEVRLVDMPHP